MVDPDYVRAAIAKIEEAGDDDGVAHARENDLYEAVLQAIAAGTCENPTECARLALTSKALDFCRYYS